jgi:hypothetical protein
MFRAMGIGRLEFIAIAACALTSLPACEPVRRTRECRAIADLVNPALHAIDEERTKRDDAPAYGRIALTYDALSVKLMAGKYSTKRLADAVTDYARLLSEASRDARAYADALALNDAGRSALARAAAGHTVKRESAAIFRIESVCAPR